MPQKPRWLRLNISGEAGAGKTFISAQVAKTFEQVLAKKVLWIPRETCRLQRDGELNLTEYHFNECPVLLWMIRNNMIVPGTKRLRRIEGQLHRYAILARKYWPKPDKETGLVLSVFGSKAPLVKNFYNLKRMTNILLVVNDKRELKRRLLLSWEKKGTIGAHLDTNKWYSNPENLSFGDYDHVVDNSCTPEECVEKIFKLIGLPPKY